MDGNKSEVITVMSTSRVIGSHKLMYICDVFHVSLIQDLTFPIPPLTTVSYVYLYLTLPLIFTNHRYVSDI